MLCVFVITLVFYTHVKSNFIIGSNADIQTYTGQCSKDLKSIIRERVPVVFGKSQNVIASIKPLLPLRTHKTSLQTNDGTFTNYATLHLLYSNKMPLTVQLFPPRALTNQSTVQDLHVRLTADNILCVPQSWSFRITGPGTVEAESYSNAFTIVANFIRPRLSFFLEGMIYT